MTIGESIKKYFGKGIGLVIGSCCGILILITAVFVLIIVSTLLLGIAEQGETDTQATADAGAIKICSERNATICGGVAADYIGAAMCETGNTSYNGC